MQGGGCSVRVRIHWKPRRRACELAPVGPGLYAENAAFPGEDLQNLMPHQVGGSTYATGGSHRGTMYPNVLFPVLRQAARAPFASSRESLLSGGGSRSLLQQRCIYRAGDVAVVVRQIARDRSHVPLHGIARIHVLAR